MFAIDTQCYSNIKVPVKEGNFLESRNQATISGLVTRWEKAWLTSFWDEWVRSLVVWIKTTGEKSYSWHFKTLFPIKGSWGSMCSVMASHNPTPINPLYALYTVLCHRNNRTCYYTVKTGIFLDILEVDTYCTVTIYVSINLNLGDHSYSSLGNCCSSKLLLPDFYFCRHDGNFNLPFKRWFFYSRWRQHRQYSALGWRACWISCLC